jgi:hypothetical protein
MRWRGMILDSFGLKIPDFKILDPPLACVCFGESHMHNVRDRQVFFKKKSCIKENHELTLRYTNPVILYIIGATIN